MKKDTLKGYILEEVLAYLIRKVLYDWTFEAGKDTIERSRNVIQSYFSSIMTIYRRERNCDRVFKLEYDPEAIPRHIYPSGPNSV